MTRTYRYETTLSWGGDEPTGELEVVVTYTVSWGRAETPPAYSHGGLPADPTLVEDIEVVSVNGRASGFDPGFQSDAKIVEMCLEKLDDHHDRMIEEATEWEERE